MPKSMRLVLDDVEAAVIRVYEACDFLSGRGTKERAVESLQAKRRALEGWMLDALVQMGFWGHSVVYEDSSQFVEKARTIIEGRDV